MEVQRNYPVERYMDDRYLDTYGPGVAAAMEGYFVNREMGRPIEPYPENLRKFEDGRERIKFYGYQRGVDGVIEKSLEGAPYARHLWHDKTTVAIIEENG